MSALATVGRSYRVVNQLDEVRLPVAAAGQADGRPLVRRPAQQGCLGSCAKASTLLISVMGSLIARQLIAHQD